MTSEPVTKARPMSLWLPLGLAVLSVWSYLVLPPPLVPIGLVLGWVLVGLAWCDLTTGRLPDGGTLGLSLAGLGMALLGLLGAPFDHAAGAACGYLLMRLVAQAYLSATGREGLGLGDAKLMAAAGAWTGLFGLPSVLLIGAGSTLIAALTVFAYKAKRGGRTRDWMKARIPLGPGLAAGLWLKWLYGPLL